jgi:hypothetical protein
MTVRRGRIWCDSAVAAKGRMSVHDEQARKRDDHCMARRSVARTLKVITKSHRRRPFSRLQQGSKSVRIEAIFLQLTLNMLQALLQLAIGNGLVNPMRWEVLGGEGVLEAMCKLHGGKSFTGWLRCRINERRLVALRA